MPEQKEQLCKCDCVQMGSASEWCPVCAGTGEFSVDADDCHQPASKPEISSGPAIPGPG